MQLKKFILFYALIVVAIYANYFAPEIVSRLFFIGLLVAYYRSEDEGFWLGIFMILSDGFFGFFGLYESLVQLIPGLPAVEVGQLYVVLSVIKAQGKPVVYRPFYNKLLLALFVYLLFLIVQGYAIGLSTALNVQFRVVKHVLPLALLYSLPKLFTKMEQIKDIFKYLFPVTYVIVAAQIFTMATSKTPPQFFGVQQEAWFAIELTADKTYRGFYNDAIILLTTLGALFFMADKKQRFNSFYLISVILANFSAIYLSATRGWTISMTFLLILAIVFVMQLSLKRLLGFVVIGAALFMGAMRVPLIHNQVNNAMKRMLTVTKIAEGDLSAGGTLLRLNLRAPRALRNWSQSKLTGLGFSDYFFDVSDEHVGNHNILLHSGIIGAALMGIFFIYFLAKIFLTHLLLPPDNIYKLQLRVFFIFFLGWFMLHSSSEQLFAYYQYTAPGIMLATYFCMAALTFHLAVQSEEQADNAVQKNEPVHPLEFHRIDGRYLQVIGDKKFLKGGKQNQLSTAATTLDLKKLDGENGSET